MTKSSYMFRFTSFKLIILFTLYLSGAMPSVAASESVSAPQLIYEDKVDDKPCDHCPKFLNLAKEVNKIVANVKSSDSVAVANDQIIQVNKLKFLYYVVRSESDTGKVNCKTRGEKDSLNAPALNGQFHTVSDTMMNIKSVTDAQFIPAGNEEVYYYYRGEGPSSNVVVEVKMNKDGTSRLRYFDYSAIDGSTTYRKLPDLPMSKSPMDAITLGVDAKAAQGVVPVKASVKSQFTIAGGLDVQTTQQVSAAEQSTAIVLLNASGSGMATLSAKNTTAGGKSVLASLPIEIKMDDQSSLKLSGVVENEFSRADSGTGDNRQTLAMALSDKDHQYLNVKTESTNAGRSLEVSSLYKLNDSTTLGAGYTRAGDGTRTYNINNTAKFDSGTLTTSFGRSGDKVTYVQSQFEKKIGDSSSLVLSMKLDSEQSKTYTLSYEKKF